MKKTFIDPVTFALEYGIHQGIMVEGTGRTLYCSGQVAFDSEGVLQHPEDMAGQIDVALDNVEAVLADAGMGLSDLVRLNMYTTDMDAFHAAYETLLRRLRAADVAPTGTLMEVSKLGAPGIMIELEATAVSA